MRRRQTVYFAVRGLSLLVFVFAALVMPRGVPAGLVILAAGLAAVVSCIGVNAGAAGERAGARPQDRYFDAVRAPQGQWPPYAAEPSAVVRATPEAPTAS